MAAALRTRVAGWLQQPWAPLVVLILVCSLSVGARVFHLDIPDGRSGYGGYVFDERYYVSAARVIVGAPLSHDDVYAKSAPKGNDPNGEHPQLGKAIIGASIEIFGDNPYGWRLLVVIFATVALALLYWIVRLLGGGPWLAVGVTALAAAENLWLVSGRIGVLEMLCMPFMLGGFAFYLDRQPVVAGLVLAVGSCVKELCIYAVFAIILLELFRGARWLFTERIRVRPPLARVLMPVLAVAVWLFTFFSLLGVLDVIVTPYHSSHRVDQGQAAICAKTALWSGACNHFAFMNDYAAKLRGDAAQSGITSYPWQFWLDQKPIPYFEETRQVHAGNTVTSIETVVSYQGVINPVLLAGGWVGVLLAGWWALRRRDDLSLFVIAWVLATWLPVEAANLIDQRLTYLYYMVYTEPALFVGAALVLSRLPSLLTGVWIGTYLSAFALLYPIRTLSGS